MIARCLCCLWSSSTRGARATRGAFARASASKRRRFALAGRGTIFLDEIGDTSPDFQTKLLRVLQEREYFAVGAERAERIERRA